METNNENNGGEDNIIFMYLFVGISVLAGIVVAVKIIFN